MDDVRILRTAAIELADVNSSDVVKVAGIVRKITNWWKAFRDPEYKKQVEGLREHSAAVNDLLTQFNTEIKSLQSAIADADVTAYEHSLRNVQDMSARLAAALKEYHSQALKAERTAPKETQVVPTPEDTPEHEGRARIPYYTRSQLEDPTVQVQLQSQLPADYDIPVGTSISKPVSSFQWFAATSPSDFYLSEHFISFFQRHLAEAMARKISITNDPEYNRQVFLYLAMMPEVEAQLREQIPMASLGGTLIRVDFQTPSEKVTHRTSNEMRTEIQTAPFELVFPASEFFDSPKRVRISANILYNDMRAAYIRGERLGAFGDRYLRIIDHDFPVPQQMAEQALARTQALQKLAFSTEQSIAAVPGMSEQSDWFRWYLVSKSRELGLNPDCIAGVMALESGMDPTAVNQSSNATGLIQLMPAYAKRFGGVKNVKGMSAEEQLEKIVMPHFASMSALRKSQNCGDYYMANFLPAFIGAPDDKVLGEKGSQQELVKGLTLGAVYNGNPGFDQDHDGVFTAGDVRALFNSRLAAWRGGQRLAVAENEPPREQSSSAAAPEGDVMQEYNELMRQLAASTDCGPVERLVRRALEREFLPTTRVLLVLDGRASLPVRVRYARILASALREELGAETSIHHQDNRLEMECDVQGPENSVLIAVKGLSEGIANAFAIATNSNPIQSQGYLGLQSHYPLLDSDATETNFRKFAFEMMGGHV
jgi:hypothetical protein